MILPDLSAFYLKRMSLLKAGLLKTPIRSSVMYGIYTQLCSAVTFALPPGSRKYNVFHSCQQVARPSHAPFRTSPLVFISLLSINSQSHHILRQYVGVPYIDELDLRYYMHSASTLNLAVHWIARAQATTACNPQMYLRGG